MAKEIKVIATSHGFYGSYRNPGDEFLIDGTKDPETKDVMAFSASWMKKSSAKAAVVVEEEDETDEFDDMDDDALIAYAKLNCQGLTLTRTMKDETMRGKIREYKSNADGA